MLLWWPFNSMQLDGDWPLTWTWEPYQTTCGISLMSSIFITPEREEALHVLRWSSPLSCCKHPMYQLQWRMGCRKVEIWHSMSRLLVSFLVRTILELFLNRVRKSSLWFWSQNRVFKSGLSIWSIRPWWMPIDLSTVLVLVYTSDEMREMETGLKE